jgi:ferredoxin
MAGLGCQGKSLLLVNPEVVPRIRLVTVLTDLDLPADQPLPNGCGKCRECAKACPAGAIKGTPFGDGYASPADAWDVKACTDWMTANFNQRRRSRPGSAGCASGPVPSADGLEKHDSPRSGLFQGPAEPDVRGCHPAGVGRHRPGNLKPGDRLPAEREHAEDAGFSRARFANRCAWLEQKGPDRDQDGAKGGIFVKDANAEQMSDKPGLFCPLATGTLGHLAQFREDVEGLVAARRRCRPAPRT